LSTGPEQVAEYPRGEPEALGQRDGGPGDGDPIGPPGNQMLFRPEEVEGVSERVARPAAQVAALAHPHHHVR
jgi:hypothetical protein